MKVGNKDRVTSVPFMFRDVRQYDLTCSDFCVGTKSQMDNDETEDVFLGGLDIET